MILFNHKRSIKRTQTKTKINISMLAVWNSQFSIEQ